MALTVIDRPQGHILDTTAVTATVSSSGGALFTKTGHSLVDGDYIFIDSVFSAYNGYWYVEQQSVDTFQIRAYATAAVQAFVNSGSVTYYKSVIAHNWNAIHLPIVYKLSSSLWPINSADTIRSVSSISNDAGYVNLNLSGDIKATGSAAELEFVKVTGQNAGIYQIVNWISDTDITIDFPYSAGVSFSASQVQYYYNNYSARVRIYAGLNSSHYWAAQKPYELMVELSLVPDANGIVTFNISDYIKSKIAIDRNDTTLDTLPNDINSFCQFYIETAEAYTYSNGYTLGTQVTSYTSDQGNFEGYAVNASLPFKTQSSGFMDQYVSGLTAATAQKFMTVMTTPEIFSGQYFDLSFIINSSSAGFYILEQRILNGAISHTIQTVLPDNDAGVYRHQLTYDATYDSVRVSLYNAANTLLSEVKTITMNKDCSNFYTDLVWKNYLGGHDYWRFNAGNQYTNSVKNKETTISIFPQWPKSYGKFADTIRKNSMIEGVKQFLVRSQFVTNQQAEDIIFGVENALLVQIQTSETEKRTVTVDGSNKLEETDKLVELQFRLKYTDDNPVQSL